MYIYIYTPDMYVIYYIIHTSAPRNNHSCSGISPSEGKQGSVGSRALPGQVPSNELFERFFRMHCDSKRETISFDRDL